MYYIIDDESPEITSLDPERVIIKDIFKFFKKEDLNELQLKKLKIADGVILSKDISPKDRKIISCANSIERHFKYRYGWQKTPDGFEYRRNFRFLEGKNTLVYDRYQIIKENGIYLSDGTKRTEHFIENNISNLELLEEADEIKDKLYRKYEREIQEELNRNNYEHQLYMLETIGNIKRPYDLTCTLCYFLNYKEQGKNLLIEWLNFLSDNIDVDFYSKIKVYREDTNKMLETLDLKEFEFENECFNYKREEFDINLANELAKFSPMAKDFKNMYILRYGQKQSFSLEDQNSNHIKRK